MNYDKETFKAEVRRRGNERIAKKNSLRKQIRVCVIPMFIFLIAATVFLPRLWSGMFGVNDGKSADMLMENSAETLAYGLDGDIDLEMSPPSGEIPIYDLEDGDANEDESDPGEPDMDDVTDGTEKNDDEESIITTISSIEVNDLSEDQFCIIHKKIECLVDIGRLIKSIDESTREILTNFTLDGLNKGYRIIVTYRFDDQDEYVWSGKYWYIVAEDRAIELTSDEIEYLTELLLLSEVN